MSRYTEADLSVGDWIKFRDVGGLERIAEIRSFHPFGSVTLVETTLGHVAVPAIVEVRWHVCDRDGGQTRVVDESGSVAKVERFPTCSVCGKPQVFNRPRSYVLGSAISGTE